MKSYKASDAQFYEQVMDLRHHDIAKRKELLSQVQTQIAHKKVVHEEAKNREL